MRKAFAALLMFGLLLALPLIMPSAKASPTMPQVRGSFNGWQENVDNMIWISNWTAGGVQREVWERVRPLSGENIQFKIYVSDWGDKWWGTNAPENGTPFGTDLVNTGGPETNIKVRLPFTATDNYVFQFWFDDNTKRAVFKRLVFNVPGTYNNWNLWENMTLLGSDPWNDNWESVTYTVTGPRVENFKIAMGNTWEVYNWGWQFEGTPQPMPHYGVAYRGAWDSDPKNIKVVFPANRTESFKIRVRFISSGENAGKMEYWVIDLSPPPTPNPLFPNNLAEIVTENVKFEWSAVDDHSRPVRYKVDVSRDVNFSSIEYTSDWIEENYWNLSYIEPGEWYWRVQAKDAAGNLSSYSIIWSFTRIPENFTIVVLPDTQYYSASNPTIFENQTRWVVQNRDNLNIVFVIHVGDIVDNAYSTIQWQRADNAMRILDDDNMPYGILPGNHDLQDNGANYSSYFPASRYAGKPYWGGSYANNKNNYQLFSAGGFDFIVLNLQYNPPSDVIAWANSVLENNNDRLAIIATHSYLEVDGTRNAIGNNIWENLVVPNSNVFLVVCGHNHGEAMRMDVIDNERIVYQLLANYQDYENGGNGFLRIMRFVPVENRIYVRTYSPNLNRYETDSNSKFSLRFPAFVLSENTWMYMRKITISPRNPENFQIKIILPEDVPILEYPSIRFFENKGSGPLPYWIEKAENAYTNIVWVRRLENSDNEIWMYYGNPYVTSAENGDNVFLFFDDFGGGTGGQGALNTRKWWATDTGIDVYQTVLRIEDYGDPQDTDARRVEHGGSQHGMWENTIPRIIEVRVKPSQWWRGGLGLNGPGTFYRAGSGRQYAEFFKDGSGNYKFFSDESWSPGNYQPDVYYIATLSLYDNDKIRARFYYGRDNENYRYLLWEAPEKIRNWNYATDPNNYCDKYVLAAWDTGGDSSYYFDWFFVRKYAAVEPTTTVGSEMMAILPTAPKLISPYNTSTITDNTPTFIWEKGEYAENHRLLVGNDNDFGSPAINVLLGPNDETYTPTVELSDGKYYWKVMAINEAGESSSEVWSFRIDTTPPVAPTLISPQNGLNTNNKRPTFSWSSVPENSTPVEYYAALSDNPAFTYENFNTSWILSTTFSPPGDIPDGLWYWRVKARDSVWNVGPWSETWSFRIDTVPPQAPTITAPSNGANINDNTPTISWQPVIENSTPVLYRVVLDDDPNFQSIDRDSGWISSTSWTVSPALPNGVWYCRVAAKDNAGNVGENSQIWFRVDTVPPQLPEKVWPEDGAIINDNTPTLVWQNVYENSLPIVYIIQVDNEPSFTDSLTLTVENWEISGTSSVTLPELPDNVYYWRVSARDNAGNITWDSGFWKFTLDSLYPVLRYPENGKTIADNTPRLEWENAAVADYWEVWLDDDADFSSPLILENTTENYFDVADVFSGGLPDGIYYWRVRGWRNGENHLFSEVWTFEISLIFPVLVSPENGENLKLPPTLRWDNLTVADNWEVWVDNDPDFSPPNVILENTSDNYYNLSTLDDGVYYWRVRGWKAGSNMFSEIRWFRIDTIPPAAPSLVSPSDGENTNDNTPTLVWNNVFENSLPVVYTIEVDNENTFTAPLAFTTTLTVWSITGTSSVTTSVLPDGVYYWRVRARDNAGNEGDWSSTQRLTVDTTPPQIISFLINGGAAETTSSTVTITIIASDALSGVWQMRFRNEGENWSSWEDYSTTKTWQLSPGDGLKTVYGQVRDYALNESEVVWGNIQKITPTPPPPPPPTKLSTTLSIDPSAFEIFSGRSLTLTATLRDELGRPLQGMVITWLENHNLGTFNPSSGRTDENGRTTTVYTAPVVDENVYVFIMATFTETSQYYGSIGTSTGLVLSRIKTRLAIYPLEFSISSEESILLTTTLVDQDGNPLPGKPIIWSTTLGTLLENLTNTDNAGNAYVTYRAPRVLTQENTMITAYFPGDENYSPSQAVSLGYIFPQLPPSFLTISAVPRTWFGKSVELTATLMNENGVPLANRLIIWRTTHGILSKEADTTDRNGQSKVILVVPRITENVLTVTVTALFPGDIMYSRSENQVTIKVYSPIRFVFRVDNVLASNVEIYFGFEEGREINYLGRTDERGEIEVENWELFGRTVYLKAPENELVGKVVIGELPGVFDVILSRPVKIPVWILRVALVSVIIFVLFIIFVWRRRRKKRELEQG